MRYSDSLNTVVNYGHGKFDLVPWRQQKSRIDLLHTIGWEPIERPDMRQLVTTTAAHYNRRIERRNRAGPKANKGQRRKRHIKIRIVFSFEFNRKMKMVKRTKYVHQNHTKRIDAAAAQHQQMFVLDTKQFQLSDRWQGYFSQRPATIRLEQSEMIGGSVGGDVVDELIPLQPLMIGDSALVEQLDYRVIFPKISEIFYKDNSDSDVFKQVPCARCRYDVGIFFFSNIKFRCWISCYQ